MSEGEMLTEPITWYMVAGDPDVNELDKARDHAWYRGNRYSDFPEAVETLGTQVNDVVRAWPRGLSREQGYKWVLRHDCLRKRGDRAALDNTLVRLWTAHGRDTDTRFRIYRMECGCVRAVTRGWAWYDAELNRLCYKLDTEEIETHKIRKDRGEILPLCEGRRWSTPRSDTSGASRAACPAHTTCGPPSSRWR